MKIQGVKKTDYTNYLSTFNLVGLDSKRFVVTFLVDNITLYATDGQRTHSTAL